MRPPSVSSGLVGPAGDMKMRLTYGSEAIPLSLTSGSLLLLSVAMSTYRHFSDCLSRQP